MKIVIRSQDFELNENMTPGHKPGMFLLKPVGGKIGHVHAHFSEFLRGAMTDLTDYYQG